MQWLHSNEKNRIHMNECGGTSVTSVYCMSYNSHDVVYIVAGRRLANVPTKKLARVAGIQLDHCSRRQLQRTGTR